MTSQIPFTRAGVARGIRLSLPFIPGYLLFGTSVATVAAQKGLTLTDALLMNAIVCAAASELVALQLWGADWTLVQILAVASVTAAVNLRFVLQGASLRPWLGPVPARFVYPMLGVLTDGAWATAVRYNAEGGRDFGVAFGSAFFLWAVWVLATIPGYLIGALVDDPRRWGLDLITVILFTATVTPILRRTRAVLVPAVAGAAGLAASQLLPGYWFIVIGAFAGALAGAFAPQGKARQ